MRDTARALALLSIALLVTASFASPVTADTPRTLEDGDTFYPGYTLQTNSIVNASSTVSLYATDGGLVQNITADSNGAVTFDTDGFDTSTGYYLAQNGTKLLSFDLRHLRLDVVFEELTVSHGGNQETAHVRIDMNAGNRDVVITSDDIPNLADRTTGAEVKNGQLVGNTGDDGEINLEIDVTNLAEQRYRVEANTADDSEADGSVIFDLSEMDTSSTTTANTVPLNGGEEYWTSVNLLFEYPSDKTFVVRNADTGGYVFEGRTENGQYVFDTESWDAGNYTISNSSSGEELFTFELRQQTLNATVVNSSVNVSSNRGSYDLTVYVEELNRSQLLDLFPAAEVTSSGDVLVRNVSANTSLKTDTSNLSDGNYTVHVAANDTTAEATVIVDVQSNSSTSDTSSGSLEATTTATPTETETDTSTETSTATATEAPTATSTATPTDSGVSPTDAAGAGATAIGLGGAALLARKYSS